MARREEGVWSSALGGLALKTSPESECIGRSGGPAQHPTGSGGHGGQVSRERYRPGARPGHPSEVPGEQEDSYP